MYTLNSFIYESIWSDVALPLKLYSDQTKVDTKAKVIFNVSRLFFDLFRFRLVWIGPNINEPLNVNVNVHIDTNENKDSIMHCSYAITVTVNTASMVTKYMQM